MIQQAVSDSPTWVWLISPFKLIVLLPVIAAVAWWFKTRAVERKRRLDLLERALEHGQLTPEVRGELLLSLRPQTGRMLATIGWLGLVGGVTAWIWARNTRCTVVPGIVVTVASFALLTLPLVWREIDGQRQARAVR